MAEQAQSSAEQVQEKAQQTAQQATEKARTTVRDQVASRSNQAGEQISQQAGDIRSLSEELRNQGKEGPAKIAEQAADRAERVGSYLSQSDADQILHDAERVARSNPWAVVAGGLVAGFAASRFLKASSSDRYHGRTTTGQQSIPSGRNGLSPEDRFARPTPPAATTPPPAPAPTAHPTQPHVGTAPATGPATTGAI
jgi:hypothetical protein